MAGESQNGKSRGSAAPLPISSLPVPEDEKHTDPTHSLPTNSKGELTPAQRARLGLDVFGEDAQQPQAAPEPSGPAPLPMPDVTPINGAMQAPTPLEPAQASVTTSNTAPSEFGFSQIDPYSRDPASAQQPEPVADDPTPRLAPVRAAVSLDNAQRNAAKRGRAVDDDAPRRKRDPADDGTPELIRDRNVLSYGVAWTFFAMLVTAAISFSSSMTRASGEAAGPGPLVPALISVALGWIIVFAARAIGKNWGWLMILPAVVLLLGPFAYAKFWSTGVEDSARAYLSPAGASSLIDVDSSSIVSETINTDRGCFAITRNRNNKDTEVAVVTYVAETARQQADYSLAPRYARRVPAGGAKSTQRVFTFKRGLGPAIVSEAPSAPLDCATSTAPTSGD